MGTLWELAWWDSETFPWQGAFWRFSRENLWFFTGKSMVEAGWISMNFHGFLAPKTILLYWNCLKPMLSCGGKVSKIPKSNMAMESSFLVDNLDSQGYTPKGYTPRIAWYVGAAPKDSRLNISPKIGWGSLPLCRLEVGFPTGQEPFDLGKL